MPYIRQIFSNLIGEKNSRQIIFLIGARQVGKTTLLKMLQKDLAKESPTLYLDLDLTFNIEIFSSLENFITFLKDKGYTKNCSKFYLFLDEIQRYNEATLILKNIYDHYPNIKIYASGSSTLEIKNKIKDSLAGRKFIYHIYPLNFEEWLVFKNKGGQIRAGDLSIGDYKKHLNDFLLFGGYPAVALANGDEEKKKNFGKHL